MFNWLNKSPINLISRESVVAGDIFFAGTIKIQGTVNGDIISNIPDHGFIDDDDEIIIDAGANVYSDILKAASIVIDGKVESKEIWAEHAIEISQNAHITGATIYYRYIQINENAILNNCSLKHLDYCSEGEQT
jgi:cytoskeletal protein CcmA (bactofilin family)